MAERGVVGSAVDVSPDHRLVEAVCSLETSNPNVGAEIVGEALLATSVSEGMMNFSKASIGQNIAMASDQ